MREGFTGRFHGVWNVEGDAGPVLIFLTKEDADREVKRRQELPEDDDDRLTMYHQVFPVDIVGAWWNSYDTDPRANLSPAEIVEAWGR